MSIPYQVERMSDAKAAENQGHGPADIFGRHRHQNRQATESVLNPGTALAAHHTDGSQRNAALQCYFV
ncbi:hypothetical protein FOXG_20179 [Fusarium oxysporum f. sp. lycopersici 4287]|uniref:Uncharacterized protein n=2 Tax=Fusarium oxysporum TaxID=5507 RepID=A0A0J9VD10_FUSO4|nr:hypothetical protein FOXG_20179 [Fusarium oxysporum f. sp. lycopersici 4287]EXK28405.1 hypothetical protein FOMG_15384 [Fusarium oxysporum f. sp. melonis 26406]KNB09294.1 hypothetical protein FOXG_20179 [Fusarium oxysporum f. sp. lycopersici 4287]